MAVPSQLEPYWPTLQVIERELGVPAARLGGHVMIESSGNPRAVQQNNQNGWSYGLLQVVPYGVGWQGHYRLVEQVAGLPANGLHVDVINALYDPAINLHVGATILANLKDQYGTWDKASSAFFLGNPDWRGADTVNGNTGATYRQVLNGWIAELEKGAPVVDKWRPYPYPAMVKLIATKPYDGAGFDRCQPRLPRTVGSCNHITDGEGTIEWYSAFFSIGGEREFDALVDTVIGRDGRIGLLNDWRDNNWGGTRAGWANGGANGLEGDGVAFYRRYPGNLINEVLVSKEHVTTAGKKLNDAQMASSIEISTANAQAVKCPAESYPYHPILGGVNIEQMHYLFATKSCPAEPFISSHYRALVAGVKAKLAAWQGIDPGTPPPPPAPTVFTMYGMTAEQLAWFFGEMTRVADDGSSEQLPFSATGPLSLLWMARCEKEGIFPEAEYMQAFDSNVAEGREWYATWKNGWTAYLPIDNQRAGWRWLEPVS